jgi:hypothetical protein
VDLEETDLHTEVALEETEDLVLHHQGQEGLALHQAQQEDRVLQQAKEEALEGIDHQEETDLQTEVVLEEAEDLVLHHQVQGGLVLHQYLQEDQIPQLDVPLHQNEMYEFIMKLTLTFY